MIFMKHIFKLVAAGCFLAIFNLSGASPDLEMLRKKVIAELMKPDVNESRVRSLMSSIEANGAWPDINYIDVSRTGFQNGEHLSNIVTMSRAYKKQGSKLKGNKQLRTMINASLNYWLDHDFICDNWWWNQIGTPNEFVRILLIMDTDLSPDQITRSLPIATRANLSASGARPSGDRIKIAGILAKNALFQRNDSLFDAVIKVIEGEIKFANGPGLQYDLSFQHRPDKVTSTLSYGTDYAEAFAEWADFVAGTKYAFSERSLNLLVDYYLDGICQTMVYGKYPDPGSKNRGITRVGSLNQAEVIAPERLLKATSYRKADLERIINIRNGTVKPDLTRSWFFWASEYFSCQRPEYFTSVRMYSSRNHNMEMPYNSEGLMNHHYADGSNFISRTGTEYYDIFPVFDWQKIPGTTVVQKPALPSENAIQKKGLTEFVGGVTDGTFGAAVFDFKSVHDTLEAKKAWFFFDKYYVCLGTGIASASRWPVATTLNQSLLKGNVISMSADKQAVIGKGERVLENVKWVLHDSIGYFFPEPVKLRLSNQTARGSWFKINKQSDSPKDEISKDVFKLWLDHGNKPKNESYQYIVMPAVSAEDMMKVSAEADFEVISNTADLQAVKNLTMNMVEAIFYKSGEIQLTPVIKVGIDSPGLVMVSSEGQSLKSISVSDPSRSLKRIHLTCSSRIDKMGTDFNAVWNEQKKITEISIDLPQGVYAGGSVTINLK